VKKYTLIALAFICLPLLSIAQSALTVSITGHDAKCNGSTNGSAKVAVTGGVTPYSYVWMPAAGTTDSASGLIAGTYSVTVTDSDGNTASGAITIHQPAALTVSIDSIVVPPCFRTTSGVCGCANTLWAVVSGGTPPYSYLWSPGSSSAGSSVTSDTLMYACYLEFTVIVSDSNNCVSSDSLNVEIPNSGPIINASAVGQLRNTSGINTYPNPANNQLNISIDPWGAGIKSIAVYDMLGGKVFEQQLNSNERLIAIDVSGFANGDYLLRIISDDSQKTGYFSISR